MRGIGLTAGGIKKYGFIQAYIDDLKHSVRYNDALYLLFKPENYSDFEMFLMTERNRYADILDEYDYDGGFVVVVYQFPARYILEYNLFKEGKFSKFRQSYIDLFPTEIKQKQANGVTVRGIPLPVEIMKKSDNVKEKWKRRILDIGEKWDDELEVWPIPNIIRDETLNIEKIHKETEYEI